MTGPLTSFPSALRPAVAQALRAHFETRGRMSTGTGQSATGAAMERAAALSQRSRTCPECLGARRQTIRVPAMKGKVARYIEIDCWRCYGAGEIGEMSKAIPQTATYKCTRCQGAGTLQRREFRQAGQSDPEPLPCDQPGCAGGYHWGLTALCGTGEYPHAAPMPGEPQSAVGTALAAMVGRGQSDSVTVLEVAYGDVGKHVERALRAPLAVAVWPFTKRGQTLMKHLRLPVGKPPHAALADALHSDDSTTSALAGLANSEAVATLELALVRLRRADDDTGGRLARLAAKIERSKGML